MLASERLQTADGQIPKGENHARDSATWPTRTSSEGGRCREAETRSRNSYNALNVTRGQRSGAKDVAVRKILTADKDFDWLLYHADTTF